MGEVDRIAISPNFILMAATFGIESLIEKHLGTSKHMQVDEQSFVFGAFALKLEIEEFIKDRLKGAEHRNGEFCRGQDDGLRWVLDHLEFIFKPTL